MRRTGVERCGARRAREARTPSAMRSSGRTWSTAPICGRDLGHAVDDAARLVLGDGVCSGLRAWRAGPSAPSRPMPVRITPVAFAAGLPWRRSGTARRWRACGRRPGSSSDSARRSGRALQRDAQVPAAGGDPDRAGREPLAVPRLGAGQARRLRQPRGEPAGEGRRHVLDHDDRHVGVPQAGDHLAHGGHAAGGGADADQRLGVDAGRPGARARSRRRRSGRSAPAGRPRARRAGARGCSARRGSGPPRCRR